MSAQGTAISSPLLEQTFRRTWPEVMVPQAPLVTHSSPGRIDVLGGLAAEVGGVVAQMALSRRASVAVQWRTDGRLAIYSARLTPATGPSPITLNADQFPATPGTPMRSPREILDLLPRSLPSADAARCQPWAAPLVALFELVLSHPQLATASPLRDRRTGRFAGATVFIHSDIPMHAGQASSTAVITALTQAICRCLPATISTVEKAVLIQQAQNMFGGTGSHVVDALTTLCALDGPPPHILRYNAQPHDLIGQIPLPADVKILALNTGVPALKGGQTVRSLRLAGAMGLQIIQVIYNDLGRQEAPLHGYLGNLSPSLYRRYFRALLPRRLRGRDFVRSYGPLPPSAGEINPGQFYRVRTAIDHLISEHEHAEHFLHEMEQPAEPVPGHRRSRAFRDLTLRRAGRLLLASHHSYRLRLGLSCWQADWLIDRLMSFGPEHGIFGGRIGECGGGGTVTVLTNCSAAATEAILEIIHAYRTTVGSALHVDVAGGPGSAGALLVK